MQKKVLQIPKNNDKRRMQENKKRMSALNNTRDWKNLLLKESESLFGDSNLTQELNLDSTL